MVRFILVIKKGKWTRIESPTLYFAKIAVGRKLEIIEFNPPAIGSKNACLEFLVAGDGHAIELARTECEQHFQCRISA